MNKKYTEVFITTLAISICVQVVYILNLVHPIRFPRPKPVQTKHETIEVTKPLTPRLYVASMNDIPANLALDDIVQKYEEEYISANNVKLPSDVTIYSVSTNDYSPGTYTFEIGNKDIGTLVIYSNGHLTIISSNGIDNEYPPMSLSADSFYASNMDVKLKKK